MQFSNRKKKYSIKSNSLLTDVSSTKIEGSFFSVAMTTPLAAEQTDYDATEMLKTK